VAWLASPRLARHARLRHDGGHPAPGKQHAAPKNEPPDDDAKRRQGFTTIDPQVDLATRPPSRRSKCLGPGGTLALTEFFEDFFWGP
jgi:hypothetical protein